MGELYMTPTVVYYRNFKQVAAICYNASDSAGVRNKL